MKFKDDVQPIGSGDFFYDLTDGGYIKPEEILEFEDALKVKEAVDTILRFRQEMEDKGLLEEM